MLAIGLNHRIRLGKANTMIGQKPLIAGPPVRSHSIVSRSDAGLRRRSHPVDILGRILDIAGFAVYAVLSVYD